VGAAARVVFRAGISPGPFGSSFKPSMMPIDNWAIRRGPQPRRRRHFARRWLGLHRPSWVRAASVTAALLRLVLGLGIPARRSTRRIDRSLRQIAASLLARGQLPHALDQAVRPHIGPMLIYEVEAGGTAVRLVDDGPALGDRDEARPKRMLPLVIDQDMVNAVFVFKWIVHVVLF